MIASFAQWLVSGVVVAIVAAVAVRLVPSGAAAERHRLWWAALLAVLALPVVALFPLFMPLPVDVQSVADASPASPSALFDIEPPAWLAVALTVAWGVWISVGLARLGLGGVAMRRLMASTRPLSYEPVAATLRDVATVRGARVLCSPAIGGACAVGFLHPRIVVSSDLVRRLDPDALRTIVRHEAAHLERYDDWTTLAQQVIVMFAGVHPAVWFIARQIAHECEAACDQRVVEMTRDPLSYARALAAVAEAGSSVARVRPMLAPGALTRRGHLRLRVARLLSASPVHARVRRTAALAGVGVVMLATVTAACMPPVLARAVERPLAVLVALPAPFAARISLPELASRRVEVEPAGPALAMAQRGPEGGQSPAAEPPASVADPDAASGAVVQPAVTVLEHERLPEAPSRVTTVAVPEGASAASREANAFARHMSDAGAATGSAMTRAGRSIGRLFSSGGRAVSNRF